MEFTRREQIIFALFAVLIIVISGVVFWPKAKPETVVTPPPATEQQKEQVKPQNVVVYVSGAVQNPGVVSLAYGSRVIDAVNLLGGPTKTANLQGVNMAAPLTDGQQIHVPSKEESEGSGVATGAGRVTGGKININTADTVALDTLPGVGPSTAQKIIDYRKNSGPFSSLEDLKNVPGIGESKYQHLKDKITL